MKKIGLIIFALTLAAVGFSKPVLSMLGSDGAEFQEGDIAYTASDYIQDGLVAMWDGIENAGWGLHDPNLSIWKNLITGEDAEVLGSLPVCLDDGWAFNGSVQGFQFPAMPVQQIESVFLLYEGQNASLTIPCEGTGLKLIFIDDGDEVYIPLTYRDNVIANAGTIGERHAASINGLGHGYTNGIDTTRVKPGAHGMGYGYTISGKIVACRAENFIDKFQYFYGEVYCIRYYDRVLSPEEVLHNYRIDRVRFGL